MSVWPAQYIFELLGLGVPDRDLFAADLGTGLNALRCDSGAWRQPYLDQSAGRPGSLPDP